MKTIAILILTAALPAAAAAKSVPVELIQTVIEETLKSRIPNPSDPKLLAQLIYDISMGKPERAVEQAFESYKPENIKNDAIGTAQFEMLKLLLPVVGVYAETAKQVYGVVETYVNDWQDWAIQNRVSEFNEEVLGKTSVAELEAAWNDYYYGTGPKFAMGVESRMLGVIGANRAGIAQKMKEAYGQRRAELERKEKLARINQERIRAKVEARQQLLAMRDRAERKVSNITEMMELLKLPATPEAVRGYIKDRRLYADLESKWRQEVDKKRGAGEPVKTGDPETDKILIAAEVSQKQVKSNSAGSFTPPDFSGLLREYGLNSDRLLTNNVSAEEYRRLRDLLLNSAHQVNRTCMEPYFKIIGSASTSKEKIAACQAAYDKFTTEAAGIDGRLNDYGLKLKKDLEALTLKGQRDSSLEDLYGALKKEFQSAAAAKNLDRCQSVMQGIEVGNNNAEDYDKWVGWSWAGKQNPDLKTMENYRDGLAGIGAAFETLAPLAEEKAKAYAAKIADYEREYKEALGKYSDLYQKNASMAEYYSAEYYDFRAQLRQFSYAQARLNEPFMSGASIAEMRGRGGTARALQRKWNDEIAVNRKFLAEFGGAPAELKALARWQTKSGAMDMTRENFDKHYAGNLQPLLGPAVCAIDAMQENRDGFFNKEKAVNDGCLLDIPGHLKNISALEEKAAEAASMNYYANRDVISKKTLAMSEAIKTIPVKVQAAETEQAVREAEKIADGFAPFSRASRENLLETHAAYKERITRAREVEENMLHWSCASSAAEDNIKFISGLPWKVSEKVEKFCLDEKSRLAETAAAEDKLRQAGEEGVHKFYGDFARAYQTRNAAAVMALISPDWSAGDGTELSDLEENLRNNFRLYDEIKYDISGMNVSKGGRGWQACYNVAITSRIFKRNLKHEEKSRVCDEVGEEGGRLKLLRTASGSYWYVK